MPDYDVVVTDQVGTVFGTVANAKVDKVSWELNGPGAAEVSLATTDSDAPLLQRGREIQIYYQGGINPLWWGPIVRPQGKLHKSTWQCQGLLWYFQHRYIGRADRVNQLTNGGFESGETGWTVNGAVTHAIDTGTVLAGTNSEKLTGGAADHNTYFSQSWTHPAGGYPGGDSLVASAWVNVPSADYVGGALSDFGLVAIHKRGTAVLNAQSVTIDDDSDKDEWVPMEVVLGGVIEGDVIEVRIYPPHGVSYYDEVTLTFMESLSVGYPTAVDAGDIIEAIVLYAQDRAPYDFDHGKSDLNIDTSVGTIGETLQRAYQFAEHRNVADALNEFVRMGLVDYDIALTPTTRTFTAYAPRKGTLYGTTLQLDTNVADFSWSWDGDQAASSAVVLGPGDGPDRPEGGATGSLIGGLFSAETIESAPDDVTIGELDARAAELLDAAQNPEIFDVTTLPGAGTIGNLTVGDTVPVVISRGWVNINATYRVVRIEADLNKDQATYTLNVVP